MIRWAVEPYKIRRSRAFRASLVEVDGTRSVVLPDFPAEDDPRWGPWRIEYVKHHPGMFTIGRSEPTKRDASAPRTPSGRRVDPARLLGRSR